MKENNKVRVVTKFSIYLNASVKDTYRIVEEDGKFKIQEFLSRTKKWIQ
jgi:hypothetical protein